MNSVYKTLIGGLSEKNKGEKESKSEKNDQKIFKN